MRESAKPRISSESDSAALAPLQQDFRDMPDRLVQKPVHNCAARIPFREAYVKARQAFGR